MSTSLELYAIINQNDNWKKMKNVYDACIAADVDPPDEVWKFFKYEAPDDKGELVLLDEGTKGVSKYFNDYSAGYEIEIAKLNVSIKILRIVNSW